MLTKMICHSDRQKHVCFLSQNAHFNIKFSTSLKLAREQIMVIFEFCQPLWHEICSYCVILPACCLRSLQLRMIYWRWTQGPIFCDNFSIICNWYLMFRLITHYCDVIKSPASRLFTQPFIQMQIKRTSKLRVTGLCAGIHRDRWIPRTNGQ